MAVMHTWEGEGKGCRPKINVCYGPLKRRLKQCSRRPKIKSPLVEEEGGTLAGPKIHDCFAPLRGKRKWARKIPTTLCGSV